MKRLTLILTCWFLSMGLLIAQTTKVTGTVVEDNGEPVIGALVTLKGDTKVGTVTDLDGKFELNVPSLSGKLVVSSLGLNTIEVDIKAVMNITMSPDAQQLGEVVVTGMSKVDKRLFTGATDKIDASTAKLDGVPDISRALEGRSAGVTVQNVSGTFGTAPKIRVRGATSIYGDSRPLWVVDGVIMEDAVDVSTDDLSSGNAETLIASSIAGLNADDIESFQILKDGSATSLYGARAMAGVIVITTKKGKSGVSRLSYTGEFTTRLKPSYRDFNISNSQEQMGIYQEMERKGWLEYTGLVNASSSGVYGKMYQLISSYENGGYGLANTTAAKNAYLRQAEFRNTDWFSELFNSNIVQNHAVSISSGNEKSTFYASLSAYNDDGWYKASSVERYTANMNTSYNVLDNVTVRLLANGNYRQQKAPGTLGQEYDVVSGIVRRDFDINPYSYALNTSRTLDPNEFYTQNYAAFNILHELDNNYIDVNVSDIKFQGELTWQITKGWDVTGLAAMRFQSSAQDHHVKDFSNQAQAYRAGIDPENATIRDSNPLLYKDPDDPTAQPETVLPEGGIYTRTAYTLRTLDFRISTNYQTVINNTHILNLLGGAERRESDRNRVWFRGWGYQYENGGIPYYDYTLFKKGAEENTDYYTNTWSYNRDVAFYANAIYSYEGRYTLNLSGRYEGSNGVGKSRSARWLPTWNLSGAWNAHEESWFHDTFQGKLSFATIRTSYSLTGDRPPVSNGEAIFYSYTPWRPTASTTETGIELTSLKNSDLTYEKKHEFNIGTSLGFLANRLNFDFDFYTRNNYDLIGIVYTAGVGGEVAKYGNVADMKSHGFEATLSSRNVETKNFKWGTDFIFSKTKSEITKLETRRQLMDYVSGAGFGREGYPVRALFSVPFAGLNEEGVPTFYDSEGNVTTVGINFQQIDNLDFLKYEGPSDPTIMGSLNNTFTWKNFRLSAFITYSFGNKIRLDPVFSSVYSDLSAMPKEFKNRWVLPGDEAYTNVPVIANKRLNQKYGGSLATAYSAYNYSTERVADGGFIRLKDVSLSYDFPKELIGSRVNNLQLKLQATNLFLLYADKKLNGQDPEFFNSGGVASPVPRQFTFTVRFGI